MSASKTERGRLKKLVRRLDAHDDTHCDRAFCGLTRITHRLYYPKYSFKTAVRKQDAPADGATRDSRSKRKDGMSHGRRVDSEIARITKFYNRTVRSKLAIDGTCVALPSFRSFMRSERVACCDTAKRFFAYLESQNLVPIDAQVRVCDPSNRVRTCVDLVCARERRVDSLVLVELKCGFEGYVSLASGRMQFELRHVPDSPRNQHHLQLALTRELYARTYRDRPDAIVVWITGARAHHERLEAWAERHASDVLARIRRKRAGSRE